MKRFLAIVLAVTMLLTLCACGGEKLYSEEEFLKALNDEYKEYNAEFVIVDMSGATPTPTPRPTFTPTPSPVPTPDPGALTVEDDE